MYVAYTKMFYKGKSLGRAHASNSAKTKAGAIAAAKRDNAKWNKWQKNKSYKAKFSHVRKK